MDKYELLCTLNLALLDTAMGEAQTIIIGDGGVMCNGAWTLFEQDNQPDYLGYHLDRPFSEWYGEQKKQMSWQGVRDLSLSSDGVLTFTITAVDAEDPAIDYILQRLFIDRDELSNTRRYQKMLRQWQLQHNWGPMDDLGLVRCILD